MSAVRSGLGSAAPWLLALATLVGLALRLQGLDDLGLWYDEANLWRYSLTGDTFHAVSEPPLMAWLLICVMAVAGSADVVWMHLVPIALGTLGIPLAYHLAVRISRERWIGVATAVLIALSPMAIFYSREGRPYALLILVSTGVYAAVVLAHRRDSARAWTVYGVLAAAVCSSHLWGIHVLLACGLYALARAIADRSAGGPTWRRWWRFLGITGAGGAVGLLWVGHRYLTDPAFPYFFDHAARKGPYEEGVVAFLRDAAVNLGGGPLGTRLAEDWGYAEAVGLLMLVFFLFGLKVLYERRPFPIVVLVVAAIAIPLLSNWLTLGGREDWPWIRWVSHALVPYAFVVAVGVHGLSRRLSSRWGWLAPVPLLLVVAALLPESVPERTREDFARHRAIATLIREAEADLHGVMIAPYRFQGPMRTDLRLLDIWVNARKDALPIYLMSSHAIRETAWLPSRGGFASLGTEGAVPALASGRYAILSRNPLADGPTITRWLTDTRVALGEREVVAEGLTFCELRFPGSDVDPETGKPR